MKKILQFLKQRWLISLLGLIALSLILWYLGPMIAFNQFTPLSSEAARWITIGVIFLLWILKQLWSLLAAKKKNAALMEGISNAQKTPPSPEEQASQEELDNLQERFNDALGTLKNTRLGGENGRQFLYQLPWYIIIGPPGSGKTTLLHNSELKFPLSESFGKDALRGVGGTRNCDWWFAEDAVLLDTAGRYTTHDSQESVDRSAWLGFLDLLKKHRRRRPINGVLVAVGLSDLLQQNTSEREAHANAIRSRIHELHEQFKMSFPVYMLFTKCDLIAGFSEYFDDMSREERAQVWGVTFPYDHNHPDQGIATLDQEFSLLETQLQKQLIEKLQREQNQEKRDQIYTFPQQLSSIKPVLCAFVSNIFQSTRYQSTTLIRGVYLTSATQEGTPIDRIMGAMAGNFGLDQQSLTGVSGQGKSYFINHLLQRVVFPESGLTGKNLQLEKKQTFLQYGAIAASIAVVAIASLAWFTSYVSNKSYINDMREQAEELQQLADDTDTKNSDVIETLPFLNKARLASQGKTTQDEETPLTMRFGLYQGNKLAQAGNLVYQKTLQEVFLSQILNRLEHQISRLGNEQGKLYDALKTYLMLGDAEHYDRDIVTQWLESDWDNSLNTSQENREALTQHMQAIFHNASPPVLPNNRSLNAQLVADARDILNRAPLSERVYNRLKESLSQVDIPAFKLNHAIGRDGPRVFQRKSGEPLTKGISGLYTYTGYHDHFKQKQDALSVELAKENWVMQDDSHQALTSTQLTYLKDDVSRLYFEDYIFQWEALLSDIQIIPFTDIQEAAGVLNILSGKNSPLQSFIIAVARETDLNKTDEGEDSKKKKKNIKVPGKLGSVINKGKRLGKQLLPQSSSEETAPSVTAEMVSNKFSGIHELVAGEQGQPTYLTTIMEQLDELYTLFSAVPPRASDMPMEQRNQIAGQLQSIKTEAQRTPYPVSAMLENITEGSGTITAKGLCQRLNSVWKTEVLTYYQTAIAGKYPLAKNAIVDIKTQDFGAFFGPNGILDNFFQNHLAAYVDKATWRWIPRNDAPSCVSGNSLSQLKRADLIKKTFFSTGGQLPTIGFRLKPQSMSSDINRLHLDIDGQKLSYAHERPIPQSMNWPGPNGSEQINLQLSAQQLGINAALTKEGPWALLRFLDSASLVNAGSKERFTVTFNLQGLDASFELTANSAYNPFQFNQFRQFSCPRNL